MRQSRPPDNTEPEPKTGGSASLYQDLFGRLGLGVAIYEPFRDGEDFRIVDFNAQALFLSEVSLSDVKGKLLSECFPGAKDMGIIDALRRVHRSGTRESLPPQHYQDARQDKWYRNDIFRLVDGNIVAVYTDVSADMQSAEALHESETRYRLLTESLTEGIFDWDLSGGTIYLSPALKAQLGYDDQAFPNDLSKLQACLHPEQRESVLASIDRFLKSNDDLWDAEIQLKHKAGHYIWIHSRGTPLRDDETGHTLRVLGVHVNIDRSKREREELERRRKTLDAFYTALPDLFFLVDSDSRIIDFKTGDPGALYRKPEQFLGKRMSDVLPAGVGSQISAKLAETLEQQSLTSFEYSLTIDRELQHFEARIAPIDATHAALIARNITARKTAHQQLQERMKELDGLAKTYRLIQIETDLEHLAPAVLQVIAEAMQAPGEVHASISIDGRCWEHGDDSADGQIISAPIESPKDKAARITVRFNQRTPPLAEEEEVLRAVATAIELWLKDDEAQAQLELYQRVVAGTRDQIALVDHRLHYKMVNAAYAARLGLNPEELIGKAVGSVIEDQLFTDTIEPKLKEALTGSSVQFQQWRPQPDGSRAYMNVLYTPYKEHRGVRGVIASMHDITDLYQAQEQLRRAARVFSSSAEAVLMTDVDGAITDVNEAFEKIAGYKLEDVAGQHFSILESGRHPPSFFSAIFNDIERTGFWHGEMWNKRRSGEVFPCLITVSQVLSEEGELSGYVAVFSDISSIKDNEHRLELLAHHDPLTGLPNRTQLRKSLQNRISRTRSDKQAFTVMFIDLDHFKDVNDVLGHSVGDLLLQEAATRLLAALREGDLLARVGGDEFVAMLPGIESAQNASVIATKILDTLKTPFFINEEEILVSASIGICCYPQDAQDVESLLRNADTAMYEAKSAGRGTWRCYSRAMTVAARRHMELLYALRQAIDHGELSVVYQPKYDARTEKLSGFEALLRWEHPKFGAVNTQEFITVAEQGGVIDDLDYWVLKQVCEQISDWRRNGLSPPTIAVNVSAATLHDRDFVTTVSQTLQEQKIAKDWIQLELTETALLPSFDRPDSALNQIRVLGLGISIDDFGTGYSSLSYLRKLPVTELKIDASFVRDIATDRDAATIAETIFAMARSLELNVVAEGVETAEQLAFLRNLGPLQIQGFYFSKPLSARDTQILLADIARNAVIN